MEDQQLIEKLRNLKLKQIRKIQQDKIEEFYLTLLKASLTEEVVDKKSWLEYLEQVMNMQLGYEQDRKQLDSLKMDKIRGPKKPSSMKAIESQINALKKDKKPKGFFSGLLNKLGLKK